MPSKMETEVIENNNQGFTVVGHREPNEEQYEARIVLDTLYHDTDGEPSGQWSDSWDQDVILLKEVTPEAVHQAFQKQQKFHINVSLEQIEEWLENEAPEGMPLTINHSTYMPCANSDDFEGTETFVAQLETFEDYLKWESSWLHKRFEKGAI